VKLCTPCILAVKSHLFIPPKCTQYVKYIYLSPATSYIFWRLLHHLQADHCVTCSKTIFSLQCCYNMYNIPCFLKFRIHSHCKASRAEPNRFGLENKPTLWNGSIHTARRTEPGRAWSNVFTGCLLLLAKRRPILLRNRSNFPELSACFCYNECKYIGLRSCNKCGDLRPALWGKIDKNCQNRDFKLKLWEEVAAECDSSCKQKCYFLIAVQSCHVLRE
jgi:hypothetical protein